MLMLFINAYGVDVNYGVDADAKHILAIGLWGSEDGDWIGVDV
jgi:hypothetical protein